MDDKIKYDTRLEIARRIAFLDEETLDLVMYDAALQKAGIVTTTLEQNDDFIVTCRFHIRSKAKVKGKPRINRVITF